MTRPGQTRSRFLATRASTNRTDDASRYVPQATGKRIQARHVGSQQGADLEKWDEESSAQQPRVTNRIRTGRCSQTAFPCPIPSPS